MLQMVNLSNYASDTALIQYSADCLGAFLKKYHLDGLEMMFCAPWNQSALMDEFGSEAAIKTYFGSLSRNSWLDGYRENIRLAVEAEALYLVFHVSHVRLTELFNWQFGASDQEVIEATIEVVNELADDIPDETVLLFENLWWPGLTLRNRELTGRLLNEVHHRNVGIMLDTGHLMNTNQALTTEQQGVDYILATLSELGPYRRYVKGIHLHQSLSGEYVRQSRIGPFANKGNLSEAMSHVLKIDQHLPFTTPDVQRIINYVQPDYLVHEFIQDSPENWVHKLACQQQALSASQDGV